MFFVQIKKNYYYCNCIYCGIDIGFMFVIYSRRKKTVHSRNLKILYKYII